MSFTSDTGDFIGQGLTERYTLADGAWTAIFVRLSQLDLLEVQFSPVVSGVRWKLSLTAAPGEALVPGTYEGAVHALFQGAGQPGLDFTRASSGCNTVEGRFEIKTLVLASDDTVSRLEATFEQHCEGAAPALRGEVSIAQNPWR